MAYTVFAKRGILCFWQEMTRRPVLCFFPITLNIVPHRKCGKKKISRVERCILETLPSGVVHEQAFLHPFTVGLASMVALPEWLDKKLGNAEPVHSRNAALVLYDGKLAVCIHQRSSGELVCFFDAPLVRLVMEQIKKSGRAGEFREFSQERASKMLSAILLGAMLSVGGPGGARR